MDLQSRDACHYLGLIGTTIHNSYTLMKSSGSSSESRDCKSDEKWSRDACHDLWTTIHNFYTLMKSSRSSSESRDCKSSRDARHYLKLLGQLIEDRIDACLKSDHTHIIMLRNTTLLALSLT
ncbi:hypothetical protein MJO29_013680 [Puccinia striiformis f. sp. tritici]|nr:hypothetical protein MJO29_013680 [Puccinia striiformis f. sp. tritici]